MTEYLIILMPPVSHDLRCLDKAVAQRILNKLNWLSQNFDDVKPERLTREFGGLCRLRVASYRVIYNVDEEERQFVIRPIGQRRDIYKR